MIATLTIVVSVLAIVAIWCSGRAFGIGGNYLTDAVFACVICAMAMGFAILLAATWGRESLMDELAEGGYIVEDDGEGSWRVGYLDPAPPIEWIGEGDDDAE